MIRPILTALSLVLALSLPAPAAGPKAEDLRAQNGLTAATPPGTLLAGSFLARESDPAFVFGSVADFAALSACPTAWLMEQEEAARLARAGSAQGPLEYTLYLEKDCPDGVHQFVFVVQTTPDPASWLEWRKNFHKSKAEGYYGKTLGNLEKAARDGVVPVAELRFLLRDGELSPRPPEDVLVQELGFKPLYDLKAGKALAR